MKKDKKGINVPLYASILGFIALAFIIVLVIVHSLSAVGRTNASKVTKKSTQHSISSTRRSSQKANPSSVAPTADFSKWAKSYNFYYLKSGDAQSSLTISQDGKVIQSQNSSDKRVFTGKASISSDNKEVLSYVINGQSTLKMPKQKTIKADVKIQVTWDSDGSIQDYYGYQTYTGQYALTDGIARASGVDEVWVSDVDSGMNLSEIILGNYESIQGTWENTKGDILLVADNGRCSVSAWKWSGNLRIGGTVPEGIYDHIAWASGSPAPMPDGIAFMFAPAGVSPTNVGGPDLTDSSKDRIVVCNNGGQTVFGEPDSAYYKVK
jgi:hypothetical protein